MAITYPLSFPTVTGMSTFVIEPLSIVGITRSVFTLEEQIQAHQGQAWRAIVNIPLVSRVNAEEWIAFLISLNGLEGTFNMGDPLGASPRGTADDTPGTPVVMGASQTGNTLTIDGLPISQTGYLLKGDYIQLGSGSSARLHRTLTDTDSNGSGEATLDIWPNLRESPSDGATVVVENTVGLWRLSPPISFPTDTAKIYEIGFECMESI